MMTPYYIDPGSGSIIFQALVGGIMAAGLVMRTYGRRFRSFFRRRAE